MSQAESALRINIEDIVRGSFGLLGDWLTCRKMAVCKMRTFHFAIIYQLAVQSQNSAAPVLHFKMARKSDIQYTIY